MTGPEFLKALGILHWTRRALAMELGCDVGIPNRWASGAVPVPEVIAVWLRALVLLHERLPVPEWRKRAVKRR